MQWHINSDRDAGLDRALKVRERAARGVNVCAVSEELHPILCQPNERSSVIIGWSGAVVSASSGVGYTSEAFRTSKRSVGKVRMRLPRWAGRLVLSRVSYS
jgi:hypothetical protein